MPKRILSAIITILICLNVCIPAYAFEPSGFTVSAEAGMLVSLDTGETLYEKNIDKKMYPASLTKIMTVTLMLESPSFDPNAKVAMNAEVDRYITGTGSAVSTLKAGEEITQLDLLYYVLMSSALAANLIEHHNILTPSLPAPLNGAVTIVLRTSLLTGTSPLSVWSRRCTSGVRSSTL